jgi:coenzyme F420-reducing hydrogenase beta subunit
VKAVSLKDYHVKVNGCTSCSELSEGLCVRACPTTADYNKLETQIFGRLRNPDEGFGIYRRVTKAISLHPELRKQAYCGGTTSALTYAALAAKFVDAAIICSWGDGEPWRPGPRIIHDPKDVVLGLGSKYFPSPNVRVLGELGTAKRVLFTGLPCHIIALRKMQYSENKALRDLTKRIRILIGTFCGIPAMLTAESFAAHIAKRGVPLHKITRVTSASTSLLQGIRTYRVHTTTGTVDFPVLFLLRDLQKERIPCDENCFDYSADLADISVGGTIPPELPPRYVSNSLFIRTQVGEELVDIARKSRLVATREMGSLFLRGLRLFPPYWRKRARYRQYRKEKAMD